MKLSFLAQRRGVIGAVAIAVLMPTMVGPETTILLSYAD